MTTKESLRAVQSAFSKVSQLPYCSGSIPLKKATGTLFYHSNGESKAIDFTNPTDAQLSALSESCQKATFGVKQQDVLDESYRKAGKLDKSDFSINFSPWDTGVITSIHNSLISPEQREKSIRAELYKLNVYGPGSFFLPHVDTPRSTTMFGSLVIVLPTVHEGGSLIVRHAGHEQIFDTAKAVRSDTTPQAAFVAFYSDIEHEVAPVTSGYRVTLTYNLYLTDSAVVPLKPLDMTTDYLQELKAAFSTLLADSDFLPDGTLLGFGLSHNYPVDPTSTQLSDLITRLRGSDADTLKICKALGIDVSLKAIYMSTRGYERGACLIDQFAEIRDDAADDDLFVRLSKSYGGVVISGEYDEEWQKVTPIVWLKSLSLADSNTFLAQYVAYGNEASMGYVYGSVCLVATVSRGSSQLVADVL